MSAFGPATVGGPDPTRDPDLTSSPVLPVMANAPKPSVGPAPGPSIGPVIQPDTIGSTPASEQAENGSEHRTIAGEITFYSCNEAACMFMYVQAFLVVDE